MSTRPMISDSDNPEWMERDFAQARPAEEMLPAEVVAAFSHAAATEQVSLRLDHDVLRRFRATGIGWEDRINEALRRAAP